MTYYNQSNQSKGGFISTKKIDIIIEPFRLGNSVNIRLFLNGSFLVWLSLVLWSVYNTDQLHGKINSDVFNFFFSLHIPLMIWGCSFFRAVLACRLCRCAATTVRLEKTQNHWSHILYFLVPSLHQFKSRLFALGL